MSKNVQCLLDYYLTAGGHSKQMPNFLLFGSLVQTNTGVTEFDLGPDTHVTSIGKCVVTDLEELALRLKKENNDISKRENRLTSCRQDCDMSYMEVRTVS
ncbi:hypothetical protein MAR_036393 [Mya arenaria]|uniref:Uncharacterized protein n=1 Tax=Mya arenaria TaxID=6604 RepID=A0ABY7FN27_MYAAR|nr:hypothetical protein MAR_036393 [Mya arenaria]